MSRLLLILILVGLCNPALFAQGATKRTGSGTAPKTTISPNPAAKNAKTTPAQSQDRSTTPERVQNRTATPAVTYGNTKIKQASAQDRNARPSDTKANRPATYAPPTNATASKGSADGRVQKVAALKSTERGVVNWMSLEQALEKSKTEKRKIFVDMYTDWCGWCKHMDSTTFVDATVAKYLNDHYYPVKFNAEQEKDIVFKDKTYKFKKSGSRGYHELAALWLNNRLSFPTVVFLDESQQLIQPVPGYQDATKMKAIVNYFGSDSHKKTPWETYEKQFSNKK